MLSIRPGSTQLTRLSFWNTETDTLHLDHTVDLILQTWPLGRSLEKSLFVQLAVARMTLRMDLLISGLQCETYQALISAFVMKKSRLPCLSTSPLFKNASSSAAQRSILVHLSSWEILKLLSLPWMRSEWTSLAISSQFHRDSTVSSRTKIFSNESSLHWRRMRLSWQIWTF